MCETEKKSRITIDCTLHLLIVISISCFIWVGSWMDSDSIKSFRAFYRCGLNSMNRESSPGDCLDSRRHFNTVVKDLNTHVRDTFDEYFALDINHFAIKPDEEVPIRIDYIDSTESYHIVKNNEQSIEIFMKEFERYWKDITSMEMELGMTDILPFMINARNKVNDEKDNSAWRKTGWDYIANFLGESFKNDMVSLKWNIHIHYKSNGLDFMRLERPEIVDINSKVNSAHSVLRHAWLLVTLIMVCVHGTRILKRFQVDELPDIDFRLMGKIWFSKTKMLSNLSILAACTFFAIFAVMALSNSVNSEKPAGIAFKLFTLQMYNNLGSTAVLMLSLSAFMYWCTTVIFLDGMSMTGAQSLVITLKKGMADVSLAMFGCAPLYLGSALFAVVLFGLSSDRYFSLKDSSVTLFAIMNGDVIRETFMDIMQNRGLGTVVAGQGFMYMFTMMSINVIRLLWMGIIINVLFDQAAEWFISGMSKERIEEKRGGGGNGRGSNSINDSGKLFFM
eukprot:TRINITY_DN371804_c0_g1_i2.p1 TRINITY_DN371804_c0_g1~~TRINITY_DN371804_c0_g1_i2.p1  ORF type:complete len:506 (-),score=129.68 TRINITY_DN371804_c0_g1_i2:73-1590(-)